MAEPILLRQYVPLSAYKPRAYLNGFPKAGIHLVEQMVQVLLGKSEVGQGGAHWLGTYKWNSWSMQWQDVRQYLWRLSCMERGTYLMGHSGYHEDIERMLRYGNIGHIFLYRDLRDVAVSQTHHVLDEDRPNWQHQHKDVYRMLGSFEAALSAVICGMGPYPGVVQRWTEYASWLQSEDVLALEYGELRADPERGAARIVLYLLRKGTELLEGNNFGVDIAPETLKELAQRMAANAANTSQSTTFRKGITGEWREAFTAEHVGQFKETDRDRWLIRLGFEQGEGWQRDR